jgi:hypothetical protein
MITKRADNPLVKRKGDKAMEFLIPLGVILVWIILQAWVLPRMGVKT